MKQLTLIVGLLLLLVGAQANTTEVKYLSGKGYDDAVDWEFFCTDGRRSNEWTTIKVPSCWEQQGFGGYTYGVNFYGKKTAPGITTEQGRYKLKFDMPAGWLGKRIRIVFDGVMTDAVVRVNGQKAGPAHQGGFYRFMYDITSMVRVGNDNLLEVNVSKESENESVNLAERRGDYWNFGGIFRPVFLQVLPTQFIDRVAIDAKADGAFTADVFLGATLGKSMSVAAQLTDTAGAPLGAPMQVEVPKGGDKVTLRTQLSNPKRWTAETPHLYKVKFTLKEGDEVRHVVAERFGFRTMEVRERDGLYINGQRVMMRGVNRHSFRPESGRTLNRQANYDDVKLMKEMNMNAVRLSHYPPDPEFLDACDELGLYVLNELGGWHGKYDDGVGKKLVGELVTRDLNHPSIIIWDNGNEGGWNVNLDKEFDKWDIQKRPVMHPQQYLNGIESMHYRSYGETQEYLRGDYIYMPTEFLHGLYDGGHGAGLYDYWEMMRLHPRCAGGFLWVLSDEGVARADQNGRIDNDGDHGADGIVGPHHEREGSFNTIREVWCPVQIMNSSLTEKFNGVLQVENRYDFTNLSQCKFAWELAAFPRPEQLRTGHRTVAEGEVTGPNVAPHAEGEMKIMLPDSWREADVLYITVKNPQGESLWTWSYAWKKPTDFFNAYQKRATNGKEKPVKQRSANGKTIITAADLELTFDKTSGELTALKQKGKTISISGLKFIAARRADRSLDGWVGENVPKGVSRIYNEVKADSKMTAFSASSEGDDVVVDIDYFGTLQHVQWRIAPDGSIRIEYDYEYDGVVELMGVKFDYPESEVKSMRMLAKGPYRVWQNRLHGTTLDVWKNDYNDPIPGESFVYPEFKGYYNDWRWVTFETTEGSITMGNELTGNFLGVYTPRDGRDAQLYTIPQTGLAVLDVIPAVRNKVNTTDLVGPSSQAQRVSGVRSGVVHLKLKANK